MRRAVVLLSGGLDSATVLAIAKSQGFLPYGLTIGYGQRHSIEVEAARKTAVRQGVAEHKVIELDLTWIGGSALTAAIDVPKNRSEAEMLEIPVTYVPARNTIFLSVALGYAEVIGAFDIFIGVNAVDYSGYPDCRPEFISAFQNLARLATKSGVGGAEVSIHAPLVHLRKTDIIREGLRLGVDFSATHSCYDPLPIGRPCLACDSCQIRLAAFEELGLTDPVTI
jgi:7-cyano-7-deazaguanine synthase